MKKLEMGLPLSQRELKKHGSKPDKEMVRLKLAEMAKAIRLAGRGHSALGEVNGRGKLPEVVSPYCGSRSLGRAHWSLA